MSIPRPTSASAISRRSFLQRSALTATVAVAGSGLLAACGTGSSSDDDTGGGNGDGNGGNGKMTWLSPIPLESLSLSPELLALVGGHFTKHGLDVTLQPTKGTAQATQTLLTGIAPIARVGQIDAMRAIMDSGQPLVTIGTLVHNASVRFAYSTKNVVLDKPEAFVGQTMGVPSEGGTSDNMVSLVVASAGIDPKQVKRQVVGLTPGTFNLVERGRLAGYVVSIDTATILQSQHPDAGVFDPSEYVIGSQVYVTTKDALKTHADGLRAFLAGINDAVAAMAADTNFDETIKQLRAKYSFATLDDDKIARAALTTMMKGWTQGDASKPLLVTDEAKWTKGYEEKVKAGVVKAGGDPASWIDNSLLPTS
jgi:NitT/TauT family transport system substrate-binding protein